MRDGIQQSQRWPIAVPVFLVGVLSVVIWAVVVQWQRHTHLTGLLSQQQEVMSSVHQIELPTNQRGDDIRIGADRRSWSGLLVDQAGIGRRDQALYQANLLAFQGEYDQAMAELTADDLTTVQARAAIDLLAGAAGLATVDKVVLSHLHRAGESYGVMLSGGIVNPQIVSNYQVSQSLGYVGQLQYIVDLFDGILGLFGSIEGQIATLLDLIDRTRATIRRVDMSSSDDGEQADQACLDEIVKSVVQAENDLLSILQFLEMEQREVVRSYTTCLQQPDGCRRELEDQLTPISQALSDISLLMSNHETHYRGLLFLIEDEKRERVNGLCDRRGGVANDETSGLLEGALRALDQQIQELRTDPERDANEQVEQELPAELEELRQFLDEYVPDERDRQILEVIRKKQQQRYDERDEVYQEGVTYPQQIQEMFWQFFGTLSGETVEFLDSENVR